MKISIVIPTYNESKSLERLVSDVFKVLPDVELVIVDDNSPDGTGRIADKLAHKFNIVVVHRKKKLGLSSAIVAGFQASEHEIVGVMDADLSHPPNVLPKLLEPILKNEADLVIGSRRIPGGGDDEWSNYRQFVSWGATMMARILTPVHDPMSGLFVLKKCVIARIDFKTIGYKILLEILVKGKYTNAVEVPYIFAGREFGHSKLGVSEYLKYFIDWSRMVSYKIFKN